MRSAVAVTSLALVLCLSGGALSGGGQSTIQTGAPTGGLIVVSTSVPGDGAEQLTVVDPVTKTLGVYHIDKATGKVSLRSVRKVQWDLEMNAFNTSDPQPLDVRAMVSPR